MDVTANLDRRLELQQVGLLHEDIPGRDAEIPDLRLRELHLLPGPRRSDVDEPPDDVVQRGGVHRPAAAAAALRLRRHRRRVGGSVASPSGNSLRSCCWGLGGRKRLRSSLVHGVFGLVEGIGRIF